MHYTDENEALEKQLKEVLEKGISQETMKSMTKKVQDIMCQVEDDIMYRLTDELAPNLAAYVKDMAQKTVEMLLEGNEKMMREYLSCKTDGSWTGRSTDKTWVGDREECDHHPVIHGRLFEQGCVELRKKIVEAHKDLLATERMIDLEDQVKCLVGQINKLNAEKQELCERLRA